MEADIFVQLLSECREEMYALSYQMLKNYHDVEDAVSSTVLKAYEKRDTLHNRSKFKSWILRILINEIKQMIRKREKMIVSDYGNLDIKTTVSDANKELWDLVFSLQQDLRAVIILYYYQGYSTKEIAKILQKPKGTILSRLSRARASLKKML